jgi:hypothetical protein
MIYSQLLREKEKKKRERNSNMRERERERAWINWGAQEGVQKKVREGVGGKLGSKNRNKKTKSREFG